VETLPRRGGKLIYCLGMPPSGLVVLWPITWLAAMPEDVKPERDAFWGKLLSGWELDGYDGMAAAFQGFINEIGSMEELRQVFQEDARRLATGSQARPKRTQPRRPPSRKRRRPVR
jgi:hypothetical protein